MTQFRLVSRQICVKSSEQTFFGTPNLYQPLTDR